MRGSDIQHLASRIQHPASSIQHQASSIKYDGTDRIFSDLWGFQLPEPVKRDISIWLLFICLSATSAAQQPLWYTNIDLVRGVLDRQESRFEGYSVRLGEAWYEYYTGELKSFDRLEGIRLRPYASRDSLELIFQHWMPKQASLTDTMLQRRLIQWHNIMAASQVNDVDEIRQLQSQLEEWLSPLGQVPGRPSDSELEEMTRVLLEKRNAWAKALGFPGYIDMMLLVSGIQPDALQYWLDVIDTVSIGPYRKLLQEIRPSGKNGAVSVRDIYSLYERYVDTAPPDPDPSQRRKVLNGTLAVMGVDLNRLPVTSVERVLPPPMAGQGISVAIPGDFRLVVNPGIPFSTLMHETGHGLACVFNRNPWPTLKGYEWLAGGSSPIMAEGLAEWAAGILHDPDWMERNTKLGHKEIQRKVADERRYLPVHIRLMLFSTWMDLETCFNPTQNLDSLQARLMKRYLLVDDISEHAPTIANVMYVSYPVYQFNYLFAEVIQWQIHRELKRRLGKDYLSNPETMQLMKRYFYN